MIIVVDRDLCIGAAPCVAVAPQVFDLDEEGKAIVLPEAIKKEAENGKVYIKEDIADDDTLLMAAQSCPVQAIKVYDNEGNQLFPKK